MFNSRPRLKSKLQGPHNWMVDTDAEKIHPHPPESRFWYELCWGDVYRLKILNKIYIYVSIYFLSQNWVLIDNTHKS